MRSSWQTGDSGEERQRNLKSGTQCDIFRHGVQENVRWPITLVGVFICQSLRNVDDISVYCTKRTSVCLNVTATNALQKQHLFFKKEKR